MTDPNLYLLTHPEKWPHRSLLPLCRRSGNIIYNKRDAGIIVEDDYAVFGRAVTNHPQSGWLEESP